MHAAVAYTVFDIFECCIGSAQILLRKGIVLSELIMTQSSRTADSQSPAQPLRDPTEWKTGDEPITAAQRSYVQTLATEAGMQLEDVDSLTKADAALLIEELQQRTGRGPSAKNA